MVAAHEQDSSPPASLTEGTLVAGKYRVGRLLGSGGMGFVVAAVHETLGTQLALKVIRPETVKERNATARFLQEGRAAAMLQNEHVVRVYDLGTLDDDTPFLVMERLEGIDLERLLAARARLTVAEAVEIVQQTAEALAEAHAHGIVHRDLKPQNLFLLKKKTHALHVKVLDFGIAKFLSDEHFQVEVATHSAAMMGSPLYMSPEQMRSAKDADPRSDLWSLGVLLYQLLAGHLPFEAETLPALGAKVLTERAPRLTAELGLPPGLAELVQRLLETEPENRFQSAEELLVALRPFRAEREVYIKEIEQLAALPAHGAAEGPTIDSMAYAGTLESDRRPSFPASAASVARGGAREPEPAPRPAGPTPIAAMARAVAAAPPPAERAGRGDGRMLLGLFLIASLVGAAALAYGLGAAQPQEPPGAQSAKPAGKVAPAKPAASARDAKGTTKAGKPTTDARDATAAGPASAPAPNPSPSAPAAQLPEPESDH